MSVSTPPKARVRPAQQNAAVAVNAKDPTDPIRLRASRYPEVDEGTACTQSSFKTAKRAFLFVGMQGGRYKAMFKLQRSIPQATRLAEKEPDRYEVGSTGWITTRFTSDQPLPKPVWEKWLDESYELSRVSGTRKRSAKKKATKKRATKKATRGRTQSRGSR